MGSASNELPGADLRAGVRLEQLEQDRPFAGHDGSEAVVLIRKGDAVFAIGGTCTHYSGPLADGLVTGGCIRCPWHHAQFSISTGEVVGPPALNSLPAWETSIRDGLVYLGEKRAPAAPARELPRQPDSVVIVGAGAAGMMAAETLRKWDYAGPITMIDPDADAPYDRPNLSKDYLAGNAPDEWMTLRDADFYAGQQIERLIAEVVGIRPDEHVVLLGNGTAIPYGALLIATGGIPIRPPIAGVDRSHVHVLRSWRDARALIESLQGSPRVVIAGASFIGMEAAAALRARAIDVTVVAPESVPFARVLGEELGQLLQQRHQEHGVSFRLGHTLAEIRESSVRLDDGSAIDCDVVLLGVGVRPATHVAEAAGLRVDNGVVVNEQLETSARDIYAAGDIARYPDARTGELVRIEHWVHAERQGQAAARNMLGAQQPFTIPPFFWTQQYDVTVSYVGHASKWERVSIDGAPGSADCRIGYIRDGREAAVATINRDMESLRAEVEFEEAVS